MSSMPRKSSRSSKTTKFPDGSPTRPPPQTPEKRPRPKPVPVALVHLHFSHPHALQYTQTGLLRRKRLSRKQLNYLLMMTGKCYPAQCVPPSSRLSITATMIYRILSTCSTMFLSPYQTFIVCCSIRPDVPLYTAARSSPGKKKSTASRRSPSVVSDEEDTTYANRTTKSS